MIKIETSKPNLTPSEDFVLDVPSLSCVSPTMKTRTANTANRRQIDVAIRQGVNSLVETIK
jgi:hypothetical protein